MADGKQKQVQAKKIYMMRVSLEFKEICDRLFEKINDRAWNGLDKISYPELTRILAIKIADSGLV